MTARNARGEMIALAVVIAALLVIYLPGLENAPVYDDGYLSDGELFSDYASTLSLRTRSLSYGSYVWVRDLLGDGWWKQRLVNLALHLAVVLSLWGFYREILRHVVPPSGAPPYEDSPALPLAIGFFALNPVAVYAVSYLVQRPIVLATLFVILALWAFARALATGNRWLHAVALACYALAVLSKEHAVLAPLAAVPIYVLVTRPDPRHLARLVGMGAVAIGVGVYVLSQRYPMIIGVPFDEYSNVYLAQLDPAAARNAYPFSILNESYLFFHYGLRWLVPFAGWMSINMRPPFPISWTSFPHILGPFGYVAVVAGGFFLVMRFRDWRALAGVSLLLPALLFGTEFATVWVQDPFVLYRSYLWAIGVPGLVFVLVHGPPPRILLLTGLALGALLTWQALDRVLSFSTPVRAYSDAIAKLPDDPRSVGRWFLYLNRGNAYLDSDQIALAAKDFQASSTLGDMGMGTFNLGAIEFLAGRPEQALAAFERAEKEGYDLYNLPFQRGRALLALGRLREAYDQFVYASRKRPRPPARELIWLNLGRVSMQMARRDDAIFAFEQLLKNAPKHKEGRYLLGLSYVMNGENERARAMLNELVREEPSGRAYYARALANYGLKHKTEAMADIEAAIRVGPDNPNLHEWQAKIRAMP